MAYHRRVIHSPTFVFTPSAFCMPQHIPIPLTHPRTHQTTHSSILTSLVSHNHTRSHDQNHLLPLRYDLQTSMGYCLQWLFPSSSCLMLLKRFQENKASTPYPPNAQRLPHDTPHHHGLTKRAYREIFILGHNNGAARFYSMHICPPQHSCLCSLSLLTRRVPPAPPSYSRTPSFFSRFSHPNNLPGL